MSFSLRILSAAFAVCLTAFAVFAAIELQSLRTHLETEQENHKILAEVQKNAALGSQEQYQKLTDAIEKSAIENREQIEKLRGEVAEAKAKLQETSEDLATVRSYLLPLFDENAAREASQPLPFSHFYSSEWQRSKENIVHEILDAGIRWMTFVGQGSETTLDKPQIGGDVLVDGVFLVSFENFNLENKKPNTVHIKMPGLTQLDSNILTVIGDKGLDQVILDGCLKWQETDRNPDFVTWRAFDETSLKGKRVDISTGLLTKVHDKCDNRYLSYYKNMLIAKKLHGESNLPVKSIIDGATVKFDPEAKPFGGIGMAYKYDEQHKVVRVLDVIPDKPAHRAGLKPFDTIVKIDEYPVEDINPDELLDMLRGTVGSKVALTYIPQGKTNEDTVTVTLERVNISITDSHNNKQGNDVQKKLPPQKK